MTSTQEVVLKDIMSKLNFLTREEAKLLKTTHTSRAKKAKISGTIPVSLWLLLEAYAIQQSRFRSSIIAEGLEMFFGKLSAEELQELHRIIEEQLEAEMAILRNQQQAETQN